MDKLLLSLARGAGALVFDDAIARRVSLGEEERVFVDFERAGRTESAEAGFVLDCSGRSGVIARKGYRKKQSGYSTLALAGVWRREGGWELEDETHTLVETYRDGWAWSVPLSAEVRYFTVMVDYRDKAEMRPSGLAALYRAELEKALCFQKLLSGAELQSPPWSRDASLYSACAYAGPRFLLTGDAASFIDPLSSFGVKKAMMSAWVGAVTVNTCLKRPEMQTAALEFFSNREARVYASYLRQSAHYFQEAAARHPHHFWTERARIPFDPQTWEPDEDELKRDPEVTAAFLALKEAPSILLQRAGTARIEKRPGIRDREIVLEEAVVSPDMPHGVRFLGNVNLPKLIEIAEKHRQVPDLFDAYNRLCPPAELPDFLGALSVLLAKKILLN
jgi:2-polyprenyl-6-methoxyphenol hydroxylase-like FAD-dependent oxidoreductase